MKKLFAPILLLILIIGALALSGCGRTGETDNADTQPDNSVSAGSESADSENLREYRNMDIKLNSGHSMPDLGLEYIDLMLIHQPGSSDPDHIAENIDVFDFELTDDEMEQIKGLDEQKRYENW